MSQCSGSHTKDPRNQTNEEWLADYNGYDSKQHSHSVTVIQTAPGYLTGRFHYISHRTTRRGSLVLDFEMLESRLIAVKFFNVSINSQQKAYPAGAGGQFIPPKRGDFRRWYIQATSTQPDRWCRVHKYLRSHLKELVFIGQYKRETDSGGQPYFKLIDIAPE